MIERKSIAAEHHRDYGGLGGARMYIEGLAKQNEHLKPTLTIINNMLNETVEDMRRINRDIHSKETELVGLVNGIRAFVKRKKVNHQTEITILSSITERLHIPLFKEIGLFKICRYAIDFLCLDKPKTITIELNVINRQLNFIAYSNDSAQLEDLKTERDYKTKVLKAMLIWQDGILLTETNWQNKLYINFNLGEPAGSE